MRTWSLGVTAVLLLVPGLAIAQTEPFDSAEARSYAESVWVTDEPLFTEPGVEPVPRCISARREMNRACIEAMLTSELDPSDFAWFHAIYVAEALGDDTLLWAVYQRFRPRGECSQDTTPQHVASQVAQFCVRTGRAACAVQLLTRTLTHSHDRMSDLWMNGRPSSYESPLPELAEVVDVPRFVLGMMIPSDSDTVPYMHPYFVALSASGTSFEETIQLTLEAWIADPAEPDDVRARALNAWVTLESFEGTAPDSVRTMAEQLPGAAAYVPVVFGEEAAE